ncbi:D-amino-acid transaminase [Shinella yambaruensis]|uniref:Probable branched-chain-amino-acid aminotransferase n=1 Tax=Shinella yambaruensis TaxID=415996 RepID=A0ABQ5ZS24_9HYPH|nr:D-amino-acid transaminase [Shinella yambaruensis]MCJ8024883.1 D-amino-acid transaminase [Shinella yambaruensis]MCU7979336.1 D-amino-acid transaminase [Shinella yambaruensis]GLR54571.1 D-amino acid aminotransferase [Shinella yambaruensis]
MGRIVYVHGQFVPEEEARIGLFDRGFLFGDAVYEVTAVIAGRMIDNDLHLARLERSLKELGIPLALARPDIVAVQTELIARNALQDGTVYLQVSRGEADRDFFYPATLAPRLVGFTQAKTLTGTKAQQNGIAVDLAADPRWQRRDIKTAMLLGQVMAKQAARARGFDDVWLVEDGLVTEGASSTAHVITADGSILTRAASQATLPGCTQRALARLCAAEGLHIEERAFTPAEAQDAAEAFQTSASSLVTPVVRIGDRVIGDGRPGPRTRALQALYLEAAGVSV